MLGVEINFLQQQVILLIKSKILEEIKVKFVIQINNVLKKILFWSYTQPLRPYICVTTKNIVTNIKHTHLLNIM